MPKICVIFHFSRVPGWFDGWRHGDNASQHSGSFDTDRKVSPITARTQEELLPQGVWRKGGYSVMSLTLETKVASLEIFQVRLANNILLILDRKYNSRSLLSYESRENEKKKQTNASYNIWQGYIIAKHKILPSCTPTASPIYALTTSKLSTCTAEVINDFKCLLTLHTAIA